MLIENVPGLLSADSGRLFAGILRDLSESGYDAEWNIVSAASVGAPHLRKRVFIVAKMVHSMHIGCNPKESRASPISDSNRQENRLSGKASPDVANPLGVGGTTRGEAEYMACQKGDTEGKEGERQRRGDTSYNRGPVVADADGWNVETHGKTGTSGQIHIAGENQLAACRKNVNVTNPVLNRLENLKQTGTTSGPIDRNADWWSVEPNVGRVAHGIPSRVDRLRALGNAIVPQCAQFVGQCLLDSIEMEAAQ